MELGISGSGKLTLEMGRKANSSPMRSRQSSWMESLRMRSSPVCEKLQHYDNRGTKIGRTNQCKTNAQKAIRLRMIPVWLIKNVL